jgi:DinB superfamily
MAEPRDTDVRRQLAREWRALLDRTPAGRGNPLDLSPERRVALGRIALFAQIEEVREGFRTLRDVVDDELGARFANAGWTLKELLAHLASWAEEFRREIETVSRHESFAYSIPFAMSVLGPNQWNAIEVGKRRDRSLEEIFDEYDRETARLQEIVLSMEEPDLYRGQEFPIAPSGRPEEKWRGPSAVIVAAKCMHDRYHLAQIRERLARWPKPSARRRTRARTRTRTS